MSTADKATEAVAEVAEEVALQAQEVADISRGMSGRNLGLAFGSLLVGAGLGGVATYFLTRRRLETQFSQVADEEIAAMREHYQNKMLSLEATAAKGDLEDIVAERGYAVAETPDEASPIGITPPTQVVEAAREAAEEVKPVAKPKPKPPVPAEAAKGEVRNVFQEHGDAGIDRAWDIAEERKKRSPDRPYVIHVDELHEFDMYDTTTITYYEADDVLCNERDEIIDPEQRDALVGEANLSRFGDGSKDPSIVYIRNDKLELQYEVVRSPNSYAEEVHGFSHTTDRRNLERMRARERELFDDEDSSRR